MTQSISILSHNPHPPKRLMFSQTQSQTQTQAMIPPPPSAAANSAAVSIRALLTNTENAITDFSTRVEALVEEVKQAKSEVSETSRLHEEDLAEVKRDLKSHINVCHSSLQSSITGNHKLLETIEKQQSSLIEKLDGIQEKMAGLESRMIETDKRDCHMQSQLQDMAAQLLKILIDCQALAPILPNVQALPLHVQTAKNDVVDFIRQQLATSSNTLTASLTQAVSRLEDQVATANRSPPPLLPSPEPFRRQPSHVHNLSDSMRDNMLSFFLSQSSSSTNVNTATPPISSQPARRPDHASQQSGQSSQSVYDRGSTSGNACNLDASPSLQIAISGSPKRTRAVDTPSCSSGSRLDRHVGHLVPIQPYVCNTAPERPRKKPKTRRSLNSPTPVDIHSITDWI